MKILLTLAALITSSAFGQSECLSPEQLRQAVANLRQAVTRYEARLDDNHVNAGSGFLLRSNLGVEMASAHHVVARPNPTSQPAAEPDPCASGEVPLKNPTSLLATDGIEFPHASLPDTGEMSFSNTPQDMDYPNDTVKIPLRNNSRFTALRAESSSRTPQINEEIIIAGYPDAKKTRNAQGEKVRRYMSHSCRFTGFAESVTSNTTPHYYLNCANLDYDIEGMSGGVALSACTGKVIGAVSSQDYTAACTRNPGNPRGVSIAPLSQNEAGQILHGLQLQVAGTTCHYDGGISRACSVAPRDFPVRGLRDQSPASGPVTGSEFMDAGTLR